MNHKIDIPDLHPETWSQEFISAAAALNRVLNEQGPEATFLPENAHLIRAVVKHSPPELHDASQEYLRRLNYFVASTAMKLIAAEQGLEVLKQPEHAALVLKMVRNAPPAIAAEFDALLLPPVTHVDAQGQPVFSLDQIANHLSVSTAELEVLLPRMPDQARLLLHTGPVFPLQ